VPMSFSLRISVALAMVAGVIAPVSAHASRIVRAPRSGSRLKVTSSGSLGSKPLVGVRRF